MTPGSIISEQKGDVEAIAMAIWMQAPSYLN